MESYKKYKAYAQVELANRQWPNRKIESAPIWCSVDLRDGNQALIDPMGHERKSRMFALLLKMGFKEIEIGFPSASQTDFDFARWCITEGNVPNDVSLQVLVQCRKELIERTFQSLEGAKNPIVHFYNSTSELQRRVVFNSDRNGIKQIATDAAKLISDMAAKAANKNNSDYRFEYSPESFTGTELDFALEICNAVAEIIQPTPEKKLILNLPATVEMATPNIYADQIEWMSSNLDNRESIILSLHPHNDRGTGVAATELALMAGADRVEGTLFGNGERTGNVDIITLALNMLTQGINPKLDISDIENIKSVCEHCNQLPVGERHPYVGELVYTAFSGSHQDAINKGMKALEKSNTNLWEVPYLPIDPQDVGRTYEAIIRINSQSGKGGVAWIMETDYGFKLPRNLQVEFRNDIQKIADKTERELLSTQIHERFIKKYIEQPKARIKYIDHATLTDSQSPNLRNVEANILDEGKELVIKGKGTGPVDGFAAALNAHLGLKIQIVDFREHSMQQGSDATAVCYMEITDGNKNWYGVAINANIVSASMQAFVSGINRLLADDI